MAKITTAALRALRSLSLPLPPPSSLPRHNRHPHLYLRPRPSRAASRRTYHSYEHDPPPPFPPAESAILAAAFPYISTHGFTNVALSHGARDAGYLDASINLFPTGAFALVDYHLVTQRLALANHHSTRQQVGGVAEQVKELAWKRLQANKPIIHRWQEVRLSCCLSLSFSAPEPAPPPIQTAFRGIFANPPLPSSIRLPLPFLPLVYM